MKLDLQLGFQYRDHLSLYEKWFSPFQVDEFSLLQIGVREGDTLKLWRDTFPNAKIFGIDIVQDCYLEGESRITTIIGDAGNLTFLKQMMPLPNLKIIIDDAGHQYDQQITSFKFFSPQLPIGGIYVMEELGESPQIIHYLKGIAERGSFSIEPHRKVAFLRKEKENGKQS